jgi:hypothetical protein
MITLEDKTRKSSNKNQLSQKTQVIDENAIKYALSNQFSQRSLSPKRYAKVLGQKASLNWQAMINH